MNRKLAAGQSSEIGPANSVVTVTPSRASAVVTRLLQWKKHNEATREVKAKLQEDARIEAFLSKLKPLQKGQVQAAAIRNYRAAGELRWKKLMLLAVAGQQQLDKEEAECTFRPCLIARPRRSAVMTNSKLRPCRASCAAVAKVPTSAPVQKPFRRHRRPATETDEDVFERLYKPLPEAPVVESFQCASARMKRISPHAEAAFIARQEHDLVDRQRRRSERAAHQRFPHKPKLSKHSRELCAALRVSNTGTDKRVPIADPCRSEMMSKRRVRYTVPAYSSSACKQSHVAAAPFKSLVEALQQQEKRMRCITKCA